MGEGGQVDPAVLAALRRRLLEVVPAFGGEELELPAGVTGMPSFTEPPPTPGEMRVLALTPAEDARRRETLARSLFRTASEDARLSLQDTLPLRARLAWRVVREFARLKGLVHEDQLLVDALPIAPDPWLLPVSDRDLDDAKQDADAVPQYRPLFDVERWLRRGEEQVAMTGLPLLPPPPPPEWLDPSGSPLVDYEAFSDGPLLLWLRCAGKVASRYAFLDGTKKDADSGRRGLAGLLEPELARLAWPGREHIMAVEEMLVDEALRIMVSGPGRGEIGRGVMAASEHLREHHGLQEREIQSVVRCALSLARRSVESQMEDQRALMVLRVEDYLERCRSAGDRDSESKGLKLLMTIQGLSRTEPEGAMGEFLDALSRVSREKGRPPVQLQVLEPPLALPPPTARGA